MPEIGEARKAKGLGYAGRGVKIYAPCVICGKPRWVYRKDFGKLKLCTLCASKQRGEKQAMSKFKGRRMKRSSELGIPYTERDLCYWEDYCSVCGKVTWKRPSQFGTTCSPKCAGVTRRGRFNGENSPTWKGGRHHYKTGYIVVQLQPNDPYYPMAKKDGKVFEHRIVVARKLGRCLEKWEIVHHKNKIRNDNREENLELLPKQSEHLAVIGMERRIRELEQQTRDLQTRVTQLEAENVLLRTQELDELISRSD